MRSLARKTRLPHLQLTEVAEPGDKNGVKITIPKIGQRMNAEYFIRLKCAEGESERRDGRPARIHYKFNLFPVILDENGTPWAEANLWILGLLEGLTYPSMSSFASLAEDMASYLRFINYSGIDWLMFPAQKLQRPTYRFNAHLKHLIHNNEIAATTAKRRMSTVIRFYRWLVDECGFEPKNSLWKSEDRYIVFKNFYGSEGTKRVTTTDVSIRVAEEDDPYDGCIDDGGKLRPLSQTEQEWLMEALLSIGNTEMTLIHLFALVTGARIQTILTFRVRHVMVELDGIKNNVLRFPVGPGTGIDTKLDKKLVLHVPIWFYQMLRIYAFSNRAAHRRQLAIGGDTEDQYLFLSMRGAPFYQAKNDIGMHATGNALRHEKAGQAVRQFMTERVIPYIRDKFDSRFHYKFHDTRATFGMNLVDERLKLVDEKKATTKEVMDFVQARMGHASPVTTERYLTYRSRLKMVRSVQDGWEQHLATLALQAMQ